MKLPPTPILLKSLALLFSGIPLVMVLIWHAYELPMPTLILVLLADSILGLVLGILSVKTGKEMQLYVWPEFVFTLVLCATDWVIAGMLWWHIP